MENQTSESNYNSSSVKAGVTEEGINMDDVKNTHEYLNEYKVKYAGISGNNNVGEDNSTFDDVVDYFCKTIIFLGGGLFFLSLNKMI